MGLCVWFCSYTRTALIARSVTAKYRQSGVPTCGLHNTRGLARYSFSLMNASSYSGVHTNLLFYLRHWK